MGLPVEVREYGDRSKAHNEITGNLYTAIKSSQTEKGCKTYRESIKLELSAHEQYVYPDVASSCYAKDHDDPYVMRQPWLLAEILSPGTEKHDREHKLPLYLDLPSLQVLLLISQDRMRVEVYTRQPEGWLIRILRKPDDLLPNDRFSLSLAELYEGVELSATNPFI